MHNYFLKKTNKYSLLAFVSIIISTPLFADRYYDADEEDIANFNKYAHLNLSTFEWVSIVVGIVLLLIYKNMRDEGKSGANAIGCIGILAALPLVLIVLALAQKVIGYGIILAIVVGGIYFLFGKK